MLLKNIFNIKNLISIICIILILFNLIILFFSTNSLATYSKEFSKYPEYTELLINIQKNHPNWKFEIIETGLDWNEAIKAEHRKNVTQKHDGIWNCQEPGCKDKQHEPGWYYASEATIAYYMDPRNSICEDYIFQFEDLSFEHSKYSENEIREVRKGIEDIIRDCKYLQGNITYYNEKGEKHTIKKTYIDVIMEAAIENKVSPYHIASRIRQEQGAGNGTEMISGTWNGKDDEGNTYKGLYNYFNWGAYGKNIMLSGLKTAKTKGWTNPEKAIKGGTKAIAQEYILCGQNTLYLQKFDVTDGGDGYYGHQYMTNVSASKTEGQKIQKTYFDLGIINDDTKMSFRIPVYKNMPKEKARRPGSERIVTQDVFIDGDDVRIRKGKGTNTDIITTLKRGTKLIRIEYDTKKASDGYYWDKVVLKDGTKGYVSRKYIKEDKLQSNCNQKYIVVDYTNFRNGPGIKDTKIIKTLVPGQIITVIEKDKYKKLDGESWYRIQMSDGTYGYIGTGYSPTEPTIEIYEENNAKYDRVEVICTDGLTLRKTPNINSNNVLKILRKGTILTRTKKEASNNNGYIWDKVTTAEGDIGYIARQDKSTGKAWIKEIKEEILQPEIVGIGFKNIGKNIMTESKVLAKNITNKYPEAIIKNENKILSNDSKLSTGCTMEFKEKTYTIIVLGDINGDGEIKSTDYMKIKNYIMGVSKLNAIELEAADVNKDGEIKSTDYMKIKNYIMGVSNITI